MPKAMMIELHGTTKSIQEWARFYNRPVTTVLWRMRNGYSPLEALTTKSLNATYLVVNGEQRTVKDWAKRAGVQPCAIYWRLEQGWAPEDAVKPTRKRSGRVTAFGKTQSLMKWAEEYNMNYTTLRSRIVRQGLSVETALKLSVKRGKS